MRDHRRSIAAITWVAVLVCQESQAQVLVLDDALLGSAMGTIDGGTFLADGWRVNNQYDSIYWHIPTVSHGTAEWSVRGLNSNEGRPGMEDKSELFHMYDYTFGDADDVYSPGYRDNTYKHFVRKIGTLGSYNNSIDAMEVVYKIGDPYFEVDTPVVSWTPSTTYRFREEWGPDGSGSSYLRLYRNGTLLLNESLPGIYAPVGHSVRIGASTRRAADAGAPVDAVFSNLKVWDLSVNEPLPPLPPPRIGDVGLDGQALIDAGGEFTGLGASYFQALRRTKFDRARYRSDLDYLARNGFDYIRTLSMVGWYDAWEGKEIAPISFQNENGASVQGWNDYWQQFREMIDIAYDEFGLRTQVTLFADAQLMPNEADRIAHMQNVLANLEGREHKVMLLEVANEYWQNGFPDPGGVAKVREFGDYLADRTNVLVALSSTNNNNATLQQMYQGSSADVATEHFSRDIGTVEGGWLPVRDPWRVNSAVGVPPVISNEPIGPGSSVNSENDPIKLVSAAAFAWMAGLPAHVYHTNAGVFGNMRFEDMAGVTDFRHVQNILPGDIANWPRSEGKDALAPFTTYANGQANKWYTEVASPNSGVVRNIANVKGDDFYTLPIGILGGGVELQARQNMTVQVFNPLNGEVVRELTPSATQRFTLEQGPQAYIIRGSYADDGPARINLDAVNDPHGLLHLQGGDGDTMPATIGGRSTRQNENPNEDFYFYFAAADWFTHQGSDPELYITIQYFDDGNGSLTLQYDSNTGSTLPAFYKNGGSVALTDSQAWKTHTFHIADAYFGNRQNWESDFRIFGGVGNTFYLDSAIVSTTLYLAGDLNGDGFVGQDDLNLILSRWGQSATAGNWLLGDPSGDGFVGQDDLNAVLGNWGSGLALGASSAVCEPNSAILCCAAAIVGLALRCRHPLSDHSL